MLPALLQYLCQQPSSLKYLHTLKLTDDKSFDPFKPSAMHQNIKVRMTTLSRLKKSEIFLAI